MSEIFGEGMADNRAENKKQNYAEINYKNFESSINDYARKIEKDLLERGEGKEVKYQNIEIIYDLFLDYHRNKTGNGRGEKKVYRPRRIKRCYCGAHSTGKNNAKGRIKKPWNNTYKKGYI